MRSTRWCSKIAAPRSCGGLSQRGKEFAGIERPAGNFVDNTQGPGIIPSNGRIRQPFGAADLPCASQRKIAINAKLCEDSGKAAENIAQAGKIAGCGLRQSHSARPAAGAGADAVRLETITDFPGSSRRSHAAAAKPVNPAPTMAKSSCRRTGWIDGVKRISQGRNSPRNTI